MTTLQTELYNAIHAVNSMTIPMQHCNEKDLTCKTKTSLYVESRMAVVYYLRERGLSLHDIGRLINRNHASVIHSYRTFCDQSHHDVRLRKIKEELDNSVPRQSPEARMKQYNYHITKARQIADELGIAMEELI